MNIYFTPILTITHSNINDLPAYITYRTEVRNSRKYIDFRNVADKYCRLESRDRFRTFSSYAFVTIILINSLSKICTGLYSSIIHNNGNNKGNIVYIKDLFCRIKSQVPALFTLCISSSMLGLVPR